jgi:hypothetical protein
MPIFMLLYSLSMLQTKPSHRAHSFDFETPVTIDSTSRPS